MGYRFHVHVQNTPILYTACCTVRTFLLKADLTQWSGRRCNAITDYYFGTCSWLNLTTAQKRLGWNLVLGLHMGLLPIH